MIASLACSAFIIYLYRNLSTEARPVAEYGPTDSLETELEALDARISALESKIEK